MPASRPCGLLCFWVGKGVRAFMLLGVEGAGSGAVHGDDNDDGSATQAAALFYSARPNFCFFAALFIITENQD